MERRDLFAVHLGQILYGLTEADVIDIHTCDKDHTGQIVLFAEIPCLLGTNLYTGFTTDNDDRCICGSNSLFCFTDKIKESRGIQNIDLAAVPFDRHQRCRN